MLDYNHRPTCAERLNAVIDEAIAAERAAVAPRTYLGGSRLGHGCERALQFEFAGAPKDEGQEFSGQTLRIAQRMSDRAVRILQATDAGGLLPRIATSRDFHECRMCPWADRCWGLAA